MELRFIPHKNIDRSAWNDTIGKAINSRVYALAEYLDIITNYQWDALVTQDYSYIMPLPFKKVPAFTLLRQPLFSQQLGIFSAGQVTDEVVAVFLGHISSHYSYLNLHLNSGNPLEGYDTIEIKYKSNFEIELKSYEQIAGNYTAKFLRDLRISDRYQTEYVPIIECSFIIKLYFRQLAEKNVKLPSKVMHRLTKIVSDLSENDMIRCRAIYYQGELCGAVLLIMFNGRLYNLVSIVTEKGKKIMANYTLYDRLFKEFSGSHMIFDFEGSDLPGVKKFYAQMGGINRPYPVIFKNTLPPIIAKLI